MQFSYVKKLHLFEISINPSDLDTQIVNDLSANVFPLSSQNKKM